MKRFVSCMMVLCLLFAPCGCAGGAGSLGSKLLWSGFWGLFSGAGRSAPARDEENLTPEQRACLLVLNDAFASESQIDRCEELFVSD